MILFCEDGVARIISHDLHHFVLRHSLRIHDQPITAAAISDDSLLMATFTKEKLFFSKIMSVDDHQKISIVPIGFYSLLQPKESESKDMHSIHWSADNQTLISIGKRTIITFSNPKSSDFNTSSTYEIDLQPNILHFVPIEKRIIEEKEEEMKEEIANESKEEKNEVITRSIFEDIPWEISCILPLFSTSHSTTEENKSKIFIALFCPENDSFNGNDSNTAIAHALEYFFIFDFSTNKIIELVPTFLENKKDFITNFSYSISKEFLLVSSHSTLVQIRSIRNGFQVRKYFHTFLLFFISFIFNAEFCQHSSS